jgi:hypothetical protein
MGLFSFFKRRNKGASSTASADVAAQQAPIPPTWHHALTEIAIVTDPLGNTPGTHLDRDFLFSIIASITGEISRSALDSGAENADSSDPVHALPDEISAKAAAEGIAIAHHEVVGLTFEPSLGFAARLSAHSKKYTVLLGAQAAVARASTPFHEEILAFIGNELPVSTETLKANRYVLAIDGIAYVALTTSSELR